MQAIHFEKVLKKDGEILLTDLPCKRGEQVKFVMFVENSAKTQKRTYTAKDMLNSEIIGLWKKRTDIADSSAFARNLREKAQNRKE